ncbi:uncharacterized protein LOC142355817, partial [Convolutriloba macropyga]|uniref:uncharacterized protein LOC142355817 n=1 Tax=Convolutriloba macropyga TaxID=536237 RepID=UPI003F529027
VSLHEDSVVRSYRFTFRDETPDDTVLFKTSLFFDWVQNAPLPVHDQVHSISGITYLGAILDGAGTERRSGRVYSPSTCFFFDFDEMATSGLKMYDNCNSSMVAREIRQLYHTIRLTSDGYAEIVFSHYGEKAILLHPMGGWQAMVLENAGDIYLYKEKAGETTHEGKQMISLPSSLRGDYCNSSDGIWTGRVLKHSIDHGPDGTYISNDAITTCDTESVVKDLEADVIKYGVSVDDGKCKYLKADPRNYGRASEELTDVCQIDIPCILGYLTGFRIADNVLNQKKTMSASYYNMNNCAKAVKQNQPKAWMAIMIKHTDENIPWECWYIDISPIIYADQELTNDDHYITCFLT